MRSKRPAQKRNVAHFLCALKQAKLLCDTPLRDILFFDVTESAMKIGAPSECSRERDFLVFTSSLKGLSRAPLVVSHNNYKQTFSTEDNSIPITDTELCQCQSRINGSITETDSAGNFREKFFCITDTKDSQL